MKFIAKLIFQIFSNTVGIFAAAQLIRGFSFTGGFQELLIAAAILGLINIFLRPLLKLLFGPFIILTLGLFSIVINAGLLLLLDFFTPALTIGGYLPLLFASLLIGLINFLVTASGRTIFKE